ncbi:Ppx/GppA phosphatase family protein [Peptostreptococcus porci]|uniref:Ppx/GppA phosphatase family protein n=1 Tax=Peptostreptococcus porci TaxID=2652282 RepID=UPI0023F3AF26|nr:Ppx/GppA phosphatase family protein [Peptostreptococcus porci]MDD7183614.1 Ppx/GppA phosphatase family protein [Peptostreptococcus porci]
MRYGIIDIGTNSMRLLLAQYNDGAFEYREKIIDTTRLGEGVDSEGMISKESISGNIDALQKLKKIAIDYGCDEIHCIGTAALRNARNSLGFVELAKKVTGLDVEIISGDREALLGYVGVIGGLKSIEDNFLVIDIGGGSTEFIVGNNEEILFKESVDIGALKLTEKFIKSIPETDETIRELRKYINIEIRNVISKILSLGIPMKLIGIGGTITSVSAINQKLENYSMEKIHLSEVTIDDIKSQVQEIRSMTSDDRENIKGLQKKRSKIILAGEYILMEIMDSLQKNKIIVSEFDNLEGYILFSK